MSMNIQMEMKPGCLLLSSSHMAIDMKRSGQSSPREGFEFETALRPGAMHRQLVKNEVRWSITIDKLETNFIQICFDRRWEMF